MTLKNPNVPKKCSVAGRFGCQWFWWECSNNSWLEIDVVAWSRVLFWHYDCLRQVTIKIALVGLLVTIFQVMRVKFSIK